LVSRFVAFVALASLGACRPSLDLGDWTCSEDGEMRAIPAETAPIGSSWSSGFESGLCDYTEHAGFCYALDGASYEVTSSQFHSGKFAAAFKVKVDGSNESQARCVRQGALPVDAYYGAWYYLPEAATTADNWNLFHFRAGNQLPTAHGTIDVSLVNSRGALRLAVFGLNHAEIGDSATAPEVPIRSWFHVQLRMKRADGANGAVALYQNGDPVLDVDGVTTDDSPVGQWLVGNLANDLAPADFTLYVDDVSISDTL